MGEHRVYFMPVIFMREGQKRELRAEILIYYKVIMKSIHVLLTLAGFVLF